MNRCVHKILLLTAALLATPHVAADTTAFINVNVVSMAAETVLPAQTVLVDGGIITVIGNVDDVPIPRDALAIDGTDRYLMPGVAEMHAHVPAANSSELDRYFTLFVANGITTIRGMLGHHSHLRLRQQLVDGEIFGPRLTTSVLFVERTHGQWCQRR